jgi:hypothetical protein
VSAPQPPIPANPFEAAIHAAKATLRAIKGKQVIYRGPDFELQITARVGSTVFRLDTVEQLNTRVRSRDYLVAADELVHPETGEYFEPREGDRIAETIGNTRQIYECLPFGDEPGWRHSGTPANEFRIHTKRVGQEPFA